MLGPVPHMHTCAQARFNRSLMQQHAACLLAWTEGFADEAHAWMAQPPSPLGGHCASELAPSITVARCGTSAAGLHERLDGKLIDSGWARSNAHTEAGDAWMNGGADG